MQKAKDISRRFTEKDKQKSKCMKRCSTSFVIKEMKMKIKLSYHYIPFRMVKTKKNTALWNRQ